jgi:hypothetical protein
MVASGDAPIPLLWWPVTNLSSDERRGTTDFGAVVPLSDALIGSEGGTELDAIAPQMDSAMFFAMNEFGPLSHGRRFFAAHVL